jgi:hypothetical protein
MNPRQKNKSAHYLRQNIRIGVCRIQHDGLAAKKRTLKVKKSYLISGKGKQDIVRQGPWRAVGWGALLFAWVMVLWFQKFAEEVLYLGR